MEDIKMKVEIENGRIIKKFGEVKCGEIFIANNKAYVKLNNLLENNNNSRGLKLFIDLSSKEIKLNYSPMYIENINGEFFLLDRVRNKIVDAQGKNVLQSLKLTSNVVNEVYFNEDGSCSAAF